MSILTLPSNDLKQLRIKMSKGERIGCAAPSTTLRRPIWRRPSKPTEAVFRYFPALPGEIRNVIYEILIQSALSTPKGLLKKSPTANFPSTTPFTITALPRWNGPPVLKFAGIGNLQILLASKKVYAEVSTLLYPHVHSLILGGYTLQHRAEDPRARWLATFTALERRPGLLDSVKDITLKLPCAREELFRSHLLSFGMVRSSVSTSDLDSYQQCWVGIPDMVSFLKKCDVLQRVRIIITAVEGRPGMMDIWWDALWGMVYPNHVGGLRMDIDFGLAGKDTVENLNTVLEWSRAWRVYLEAKEKKLMASALGLSLE